MQCVCVPAGSVLCFMCLSLWTPNESCGPMCVIIQIKAIDQHFSVALYKLVLTFETVKEILKYDDSDKSLLSSTCCLLHCVWLF